MAKPHSGKTRGAVVRTSATAALILLAAFVITGRNPDGFWAQVEMRALDWRFVARGVREPVHPITIVAIDQTSIHEIGRWPWDRSVHAALISSIAKGHPAVIGLDIVYNTRQGMGADGGLSDVDKELAASIQTATTVVPGYFFYLAPDDMPVRAAGPASAVTPPLKKIREDAGRAGRRFLPHASGVESNIAEITAKGRGDGFFNVWPDRDGVVRRQPLFVAYGEEIYPSLSLRMASVAASREPLLVLDEAGASSVRLSENVPVDEQGRLLVNFRGPAGSFPRISASDVLSPDFDASVFKDRLVLVGVTAPSVGDLVPTPFARAGYPGVEVHANVLDNLLAGDALERSAAYYLIDMAVMLFGAALVGLALAYTGPWVSVGALLATMAGMFAAGFYAFASGGVAVGVIFPMLGTVVVFVAGSTARLVVEYGDRRRVKAAFERYLPPAVVDRIADDPSLVGLAGERVNGSVLFCDIEQFTRVSAALPAESVVRMLNIILSELSELVFRHGGMLDKYVGDGLVAVWGVPFADDAHAARACRCAAAMNGRLESVNRRLADEDCPPRASASASVPASW
ncbi:MAG: adenylate/guanylate cyclase domain-containing protein [Deltaproteobacteria bacterium]|nr:adenylate/guanylate cyclase domain-containing protein [Deltaproteobacteria bacterium]